MLDFYLDLIAKVGDHAWTIDALRLVGNCCIDLGLSPDLGLLNHTLMMALDANRSHVLQTIDMASLFKRLESTEQEAGLVIGVLYNLCLDYGTMFTSCHPSRLTSGRASKASRQNAWTIPKDPPHVPNSTPH